MSDLLLSAENIRAHIINWGVPPDADILLPDAEYAFPTAAWIAGEFAAKLRPFLLETVGEWDAEDSDCDDFAEEAATYAHRCHRKTLDRPRATALAFGEFWYVRRDGVGHAINCFITLLDNEYHLFFFEPQTCSIVTLTQEEISSCMLVRF